MSKHKNGLISAAALLALALVLVAAAVVPPATPAHAYEVIDSGTCTIYGKTDDGYITGRAGTYSEAWNDSTGGSNSSNYGWPGQYKPNEYEWSITRGYLRFVLSDCEMPAPGPGQMLVYTDMDLGLYLWNFAVEEPWSLNVFHYDWIMPLTGASREANYDGLGALDESDADGWTVGDQYSAAGWRWIDLDTTGYPTVAICGSG